MIQPIRVILADDHALVRDTLGDWLGTQPDFSIVARCANADEAISAVREHAADVIVLDIDMPGQSVFDATRTIVQQRPDTRVVFLSAHVNDAYIERAIALKAMGYLTKDEPPSAVAQAIRKVIAGEVCYSRQIQERIIVDPLGARLIASPRTRSATLTEREREVLRHLVRAMTCKETAAAMHLSAHTVARHTANLMHKLDIHNRAALCSFAIREGLAEP